ncbi:unnamed protein product [Brachionus calyciflorus]|uniref:Protein-tyrosine sulfotransferase n=1 Tax=Brachionus calyciflorus TaxID=104777 RepID=A0A813SLE7_9BILA|nr:unnamed protein product [Brachionus calyciflorus]
MNFVLTLYGKLPNDTMLYRKLLPITLMETYWIFQSLSISLIIAFKVFDLSLEKKSDDDYIFIGGFGRSGTTLMRAILDSHPNIRCGPETKLIPRILDWQKRIFSTDQIMRQIMDAGIENSTIEESIRDFIKVIISKNGSKAKRLCDKDPNIAQYILFLKKIFPKSKFILMIRDPRAIVYSYSRIFKKTNDFKYMNYTVKRWNNFMTKALNECNEVGSKSCLKVNYERLVMNPEREIKIVVDFIGEKWSNSLMNHEKYVGSKVKISQTEWSSDQIKRKIHTNAIDFWRGKLPNDIENNFETMAPIFKLLGY